MFKLIRLPILIIIIFCLNGIIYLRASMTMEESQMIFAECARNSGRTSAAINLVLLFILGYLGLKTIYKDGRKWNAFLLLMTLFAVNHLIHFFFVAQNFKSQFMDLDISSNLHGFITFLSIIILPIIVWTCKRMNPWLYAGTILYFFNVTYFICVSFYSRYKPVDPAYLHRLGVLIMIGALVYVLYRVYRENTGNTQLSP